MKAMRSILLDHVFAACEQKVSLLTPAHHRKRRLCVQPLRMDTLSSDVESQRSLRLHAAASVSEKVQRLRQLTEACLIVEPKVRKSEASLLKQRPTDRFDSLDEQ